MGRAVNDFHLVMLVKIDKIVAVAGNPHQKVPVIVRVLLGIFQRIGIDDIKLDVMPPEFEITSDKKGQLVQVLFVFQYLGKEPLI